MLFFRLFLLFFFFFNDTATTEIYTLSLHDALPLYSIAVIEQKRLVLPFINKQTAEETVRSEENTSELQSRFDLVCPLLLEKKKNEPRLHHADKTKGRHGHSAYCVRSR